MPIELKELASNQALSSSAANVVSSSSGVSILIASAVFTNTGSVIETVTVWRTEDTPTASNYLAEKAIPPGKSWICRELTAQVVSGGSTVKASASPGTSVYANISGTRET